MDAKIVAIAFSAWLSKYKEIKGPKGEWLTYWEHFEVFQKHEKYDHYIQWAQTMDPRSKFK